MQSRDQDEFISAADLMLQREAAKRQERYNAVLRHSIVRPRLLIIDESDYLSAIWRLGRSLLPDRRQAL